PGDERVRPRGAPLADQWPQGFERRVRLLGFGSDRCRHVRDASRERGSATEFLGGTVRASPLTRGALGRVALSEGRGGGWNEVRCNTEPASTTSWPRASTRS